MKNMFDFIFSVAKQRWAISKPMRIPELTAMANDAGFRTREGRLYRVGKRGFYRVVSEAYADRQKAGDPEAWKIAEFRDAAGKYPWKK